MMDERLAEFIGNVAGDGCLSKFWSNYDRRIIYLTCLTGYWANDSEYYKTKVQPTIFREFGIRGYIYHRKNGAVVFSIKSKKVFDFLHSMGIPIGEKRRIRVVSQIRSNEALSIGFLRGIFNTDGSVYRRYGKRYLNHKKHYKNYAVIQVKMMNKNIIEFFRHQLKILGINTNRLTDDGNKCYLFRITSQEGVEKFFDVLKINHPYHLNRYEEIKTGAQLLEEA